MATDEKELSNAKCESATMYVEDLAEFSRVLLATTQMTIEIGWLRIQLILFCQLAGITGNRPSLSIPEIHSDSRRERRSSSNLCLAYGRVH